LGGDGGVDQAWVRESESLSLRTLPLRGLGVVLVDATGARLWSLGDKRREGRVGNGLYRMKADGVVASFLIP
jgi:hypothetical protein